MTGARKVHIKVRVDWTLSRRDWGNLELLAWWYIHWRRGNPGIPRLVIYFIEVYSGADENHFVLLYLVEVECVVLYSTGRIARRG
jgi:hypothetical protein